MAVAYKGRGKMTPEQVRPPAVAGQFYARDKDSLVHQIESCYRHPLGPGQFVQPAGHRLKGCCGLVVPHAGYMYSGPVAAHAYAALASLGKPDVAVILGPNHHLLAPPLALSPARAWRTPLGELSVDLDLARLVESRVPGAMPSEMAHRSEHSIEVQLPFLQHLYGDDVRVVPIAIADQSAGTCLSLGGVLGEALRDAAAVVLASSDFSHYIPASKAERMDRHALDAILALDPVRLDEEVRSRRLSMCGWGPIMAMLECMKGLGAAHARLLKYATSGDVLGDYGEVVAYAAVQVGPD